MVILNKIFGKPEGVKISWNDLPKEDWEHFCKFVSNGCGGSKFQSHLLNDFLYGKQKKASCDIHDFNFVRGGNWIDFLEANFIMFAKQVEDAFNKRSLPMFLLSFVYYTAVSTAGIFYFSWGDYKTIEEICYR